MRQSDSIANITKALIAVQKELEPITKDSVNPHFKNRYASLDSITQYVVPILNRHDIALVQGGGETEHGIAVTTMLMHISGEYVQSEYVLPLDKATPQGAGSAISYGRRYGLASLLALSMEDDDGQQASAPRLQSVQQAVGRDEPRPIGQQLREAGQQLRAIEGAPVCEKCGADMWDNRTRKANPKAPDFVCKNKQKTGCDYVIWPSKGGPQAQTQQNTQAVKRQMATAGDYDEANPPPPDDGDLPF